MAGRGWSHTPGRMDTGPITAPSPFPRGPEPACPHVWLSPVLSPPHESRTWMPPPAPPGTELAADVAWRLSGSPQ